MTQQLDHSRRPEIQAQFPFPPKATPRSLCDHGQWDMLWNRVIRICDQYRLATPGYFLAAVPSVQIMCIH